MHTKNLLASALVLAAAPLAAAQGLSDLTTVIYTEIVGSPTSIIPSDPTTPIDIIGRPAVSPDGNHWMISVSVNTGASTDDQRLMIDGNLVVAEGTSPAWVPVGRNLGFFDTKYNVLNSGAFGFGSDLDGGTLDDDIMVSSDGLGGFTLHAQENMQITGAPAGWLADNMDSAHLTTGGFAYVTDNVDGGPPVGMDDMVIFNNSIFLQAGVDAPAGQLTGGTDTWENFDFADLFFNADGTSYLLQGDLAGTTDDDVIVVNGTVVVQEGFPIPGGDPTLVVGPNGIFGVFMSPSGDWMARGDYAAPDVDWVLLNGVEVSRQGNPIFAGSTELFDSFFFVNTTNNVGDYIIGGSSDGPTTSDAVLVLNNERVILREGDAIDVDGNGIYDDDAFINFLGTDDTVLTDDGRVFVNGGLETSTGSSLGDFFMILELDMGAVGTVFCDPMDVNSTGLPTTMRASLTGALGTGVHLDITQGPPGQFGYVLVGSASDDPGTIMDSGRLCLATVSNVIGRYNAPGTARNSIGQFDGAGVLVNLAGTGTGGTGFDIPTELPLNSIPTITAGQEWHFQLWHRQGPLDSNFSNGVSITF